MRRQNGMSFLGLVIILAVVLSLLLAGIKIVPAYIEFMSVKKVMKKIGNEPNFNDMSNREIVDDFDRGANIDYITVVKGSDLKISKDANGKTVATVEYQVVKPLAGNLSALMDFSASTQK